MNSKTFPNYIQEFGFFPITSKNSASVKGQMGKVQEASPDLAWAISRQDFFPPLGFAGGGGGQLIGIRVLQLINLATIHSAKNV